MEPRPPDPRAVEDGVAVGNGPAAVEVGRVTVLVDGCAVDGFEAALAPPMLSVASSNNSFSSGTTTAMI